MSRPSSETPLLPWQAMVRRCFEDWNGVFAGNASDEDCARKVIKAAKAADASSDDFEEEMKRYLHKIVKDNDALRELLQKQKVRLQQLWESVA